MSIQHLPASASADEIAAALAQDGAAIVDRMTTAAAMDQVAEELRPWIDATAFGPDDFSGRSTRRTGGLIARSQLCRELIMNPLALATVRKVLSKAMSFQLHLTQVIAIGPGQAAQPIHRDQWAFDFFPFPSGYEVQCNTIWAMTDFTAENGATRIVPGSNHFEDKLQFREKDSEPAEMERARCCFTPAAFITVAARIAPTQREPESISPTTFRGCARKRINTYRCRSKLRAHYR